MEQNGIRWHKVSIIELYSDNLKTIWHNNDTFLCVFDDKNNLIADYDLKTGLKLMKNDKKMTIYINDDDLIAGRWTLFVTKIYEENKTQKTKIEGKKEGDTKKRFFKEDRPWDTNYSNQQHVSVKERERRLSICKSCSFFNIGDMTCEIDKSIALEDTKYLDKYCPEDRWENKEEVLQRLTENGTMPKIEINQEEQSQFESELEEYFKGL